MICFDVFVNGERVCRAGVGDTGVLTAILSWVGRSPEDRQDAPEEELDLSVGGLYGERGTGTAHPTWVDQLDLTSGDEVLIRIVQDEAPDRPAKVEITSAQEIREHERRYCERMEQQFEDE